MLAVEFWGGWRFWTFWSLAPLCLRIFSSVSCFLLGGSSRCSLYMGLVISRRRSGSFSWAPAFCDWHIVMIRRTVTSINGEGNFIWKYVYQICVCSVFVPIPHHDKHKWTSRWFLPHWHQWRHWLTLIISYTCCTKVTRSAGRNLPKM